jgi:RNA polymerase sigma-70 factor (ECF subfamily)
VEFTSSRAPGNSTGLRPPSDAPEAGAKSEPSSGPNSDLYHDVNAAPEPKLRSPFAIGRAKRNSNVAFVGERALWVKALARHDEGAAVAFFDEYVALVERTISRILGADADTADATQDAFIRCLQSVHRLKDPQAMTQWVIQIAVCTASDWVRRRHRRRWLTFHDPKDIADYPMSVADSASNDAVHATYAVLDQLSVHERAAFALRFIDGMELKEVALACNCSLATIKRRLARAQVRFEAIARRYAVLLPWLSDVKREGAHG